MSLEIIGDWPPAPNPNGSARVCAGIVVVPWNILVTVPGIHAWQRAAFEEHENKRREAAGKPPLSDQEMDAACEGSVDLFFDDGTVLIRPDPENMDLAFQADELLQTLVSKHNIKFLQATNARVLQAIKERGECWRISPLPQSVEDIKKMILNSRTAIRGKPIYYYNRLIGTRYLTCDAFQKLGDLPPEQLAEHLEEVRKYSQRKNRLQQPEVAFFATDSFGAAAFKDIAFAALKPAELKSAYEDLKKWFAAAVPPEMRRDDVDNLQWRNEMFSALVGDPAEKIADEILQGLSPEYFMQLEWLPGCRIEKGEIILDSVFDESTESAERGAACYLFDPSTKNFVFNFVREYGELEYINIARLSHSLSRRTKSEGRRRVYLAEIKPVDRPRPVVCILRMQKWDVAGHLDQGKDLLAAMLEAAEYSGYVLDRRLACRQLGMNLFQRIAMHRLAEHYSGSNQRYQGQLIWSTYFERDYFGGVATDKITAAKLEDGAYALALARLLGEAAAPNMIIGRLDSAGNVLFDDGDEIVVEQDGMPVEIQIADPTGAFGDFENSFESRAADYARPVNARWDRVKDPKAFAENYLAGFQREFRRIQQEYDRRRKGFDALFQHRPRDPLGNLAHRWGKILARLDEADGGALTAGIRAQIPKLKG
jgi:hypothetical protein